MALTHEDITEIKRVLDDRYVKITDCDTRQESITKKFANDDKRIDMILQNQKHESGKMTFNNWLTFAAFGAIVASTISNFFGG